MRAGDLVGGRYRLERAVGHGGMGVVFRALDEKTGEPIAVKTVRPVGDDVERFAREAAVLAELAHAAIVRYVAHGATPDGEHYLAMEWLDGETLEARLARGQLAIGECITVGQRAAEALAAAHRLGIVHRDLKPSNLILQDGQIDRTRLVDFGLAHVMAGSRELTRTGAMLGTVGYMAPEQARGERQIDARADVFSLGCVLFLCLTGRPAFSGTNHMAVLAKVLLADPPPVASLRRDTPEALAALVDSMLAKSPDDRPLNAAIVAARLQELRDDTGDPGSAHETNAASDLAALSESSQRVLSALLVVDSTARPAELDGIAKRAGARVDRLVDGSVVFTISGIGAAKDLALRAARLALEARKRLGTARLALVTGRGKGASGIAVDDLIERGVNAISRARTSTVRLDDVTAGLLDARFEIVGEPGDRWLAGERDLLVAPRELLGRATSCVGRDRELATLDSLYRECIEEPVARAVLVTGPAGRGKSRLLYELERRCRSRGDRATWIIGWGDSFGAGAPYASLGRGLRRAAGVFDGEALPSRQHKLRLRLARALAGDALDRACEVLGELSGIEPSHPSEAFRAARREPRLFADAIRASWIAWLRAETEAEPFVLVLEDLHWGDVPTVQLVDAALSTLRDRPLLVLAFARPEIRELFPALWSERDLQEIRLPPLTRKAATRLAREVLGPDASGDLVERAVDRADGSPFFLEEILRAIDAGADHFPETVVAMAEARFDGLSEESRRVLRAASIFGESFRRGDVETLVQTATPSMRIGACLDELAARDVVVDKVRAGTGASGDYGFRHALLREAAYAALTDDDRVLGHRLAGHWLESAGDVDAIVLAGHFDRGNDPPRAAHWYLQAARNALDATDLAGALARIERAIACGADGATLGGLRLVEARVRFWRGEYADAAALGTAALDLLPHASAEWFDAASDAIAALGQLGRYEAVTDLVTRVHEIEPAQPARAARFACLSRAVGYVIDAGAIAQADVILAGLDVTASIDSTDPIAVMRLHQARSKQAFRRGDPAAALVSCRAAVEICRELRDPRNEAENLVNLGYAYSELGGFEEAETALREALAAAESMQLAHVAAVALQNLGTVLWRRGLMVEAQATEQRAAEFFRTTGDRRFEGVARANLALIAHDLGDLSRAEHEARSALEIVAAIPPALATAHAALARILLAMGRVDDALASSYAGMALLATHGVEEHESLLRVAHLDALAASMDADAVDAARASRARLLERATSITDPVWREKFLRSIPEHQRILASPAQPETQQEQ